MARAPERRAHVRGVEERVVEREHLLGALGLRAREERGGPRALEVGHIGPEPGGCLDRIGRADHAGVAPRAVAAASRDPDIDSPPNAAASLDDRPHPAKRSRSQARRSSAPSGCLNGGIT